jgi:trans-aconitate 2-methyltransferase
MQPWNPGQYLRFDDLRTRPSFELAARIAVEQPQRVIDLGCGPGNSTRALAQRWPEARVVGLDSSEEMIAAARESAPDTEWLPGSIETWSPDEPFDVVFTNAAIQWIPDHRTLVPQLFSHVAEGGALAIQIPSHDFARVFSLIGEVANDSRWASRTVGAYDSFTMEQPAVYYDALAPLAREVDIWETEYYHVLDSPEAAVDWVSGTALRPFLSVLDSPAEKDAFLAELQAKAQVAYPPQPDGRMLFPFKRVFVIAYR